jgi:hypothetical protein
MSASKEKRATIFHKTKGKCAYCGCKINPVAFTIDHVIPRSAGGTNHTDNLLPACKSCNLAKGSGSIEQLRIRCKFVAKFEKKTSRDVIEFCIENNLIDSLNLPEHKFYFEVM